MDQCLLDYKSCALNNIAGVNRKERDDVVLINSTSIYWETPLWVMAVTRHGFNYYVCLHLYDQYHFGAPPVAISIKELEMPLKYFLSFNNENPQMFPFLSC